MIKKNIELKEKILKGLNLTYQKLLKSKKERKQEIVVSKNGKVVCVDPQTYINNP